MTSDLDAALLGAGRRFSVFGRRALVTGGSLSIGRAISLGLAEAGADVAVHFSTAADKSSGHPQAGAETAAAIVSMGRRSFAVAGDFLQPGAAKAVVREAATLLGEIDILVICASLQINGRFEEVTSAEVAQQVQVNLQSSIELLQASLPSMCTRGWGRVLSIGSVNSIQPRASMTIYAALKAAQHNLIINLANQYAASGVTLNTLSPGFVATQRNRRRREAADWPQSEALLNPMRRAGTPDEMVGAALLLCSDAASYITGAELLVTGGGHLLG